MQNYLKSIWNFLVKWTCTTDHKQIGTLYMLLGGFSGIIGMVLSMAIRFELAHESGLMRTDNYLFPALFFSITVCIFTWLKTPISKYVHSETFSGLGRLNFWLFLWSFYLLTGSLFLYGLTTGWTLYLPLSSIKSHADASVDLATLSMHLAGASSIPGVVGILVIIVRTFLVRVLLLIRVVLGILIMGIFFITPVRAPNQPRPGNNSSIKFFPPGIAIFFGGYFAGKVLDFTGPSIYDTYRANDAIRRAQTPEQRAAYQAEVIARRAVDEPPSPTEGLRGQQKSSIFTDDIFSVLDLGTVVGVFVLLIFSVALFVSLQRLYVARQLRMKNPTLSKPTSDVGTSTANALSIGFLTAAISVPLGRELQHYGWVQEANVDASADFFGHGHFIYSLLASDAFFTTFTIGFTLIIALIVWYLERST